jgi:hypothetical protein
MQFQFHNHGKVAEVISNAIIISSGQDVLDLIYNPSLTDVTGIILHQENIIPSFFELHTGIAGDVLQKFVNYRCRLAIVGDFSAIESKSLADFIRESNKGKSVYFAENLTEAVAALA